MSIQTPRFMDQLERRYYRFGVENLGLYLVILQAFGFLALHAAPMVVIKFVFIPELFLRGELWRALTFIALPSTLDIWIVFALLFLYWIMQILEQTWGPFKTTLYLFSGLLFAIAYSLATGFPLTTFLYIEYSLVFAVAASYPNTEILLMGLIPVRIWMLGVFYLFLVAYDFIRGSALLRGYILVAFGNYFLFFGLHHFQQVRYWLRRNHWRG